MASETKEWLKVSHSPSGTVVTCTLQQGNVTAKWTVKAYESTIKQGVGDARAGAKKALAQVQEATR